MTFARKIIPSLTVGVTAKYLYGMEAVRMDNMNIEFLSDPSQPFLLFRGGGEIYSSLLEFQTLTDIVETGELPLSVFQQYLAGYNNHGFAVDVGANLLLLDRIRDSASVLDLGGITWKDNLNSYTEQGFEYEFNYFQQYDTSNFGDLIPIGVPLEDLDPLDLMLGVADSIGAQIKDDIKSEQFSTSIPTKINLGASVSRTERFEIGILSHSVFNRGRFRSNAMLSSNLRLGNAVSLLLT